MRPNHSSGRGSFIGGSDARIIMGDSAEALLRLFRQKRGEAQPEDLSGNLLVQLGLTTEQLNREWYERTTGQVVKDVQSWVRQFAGWLRRWTASSKTPGRCSRRNSCCR